MQTVAFIFYLLQTPYFPVLFTFIHPHRADMDAVAFLEMDIKLPER